MKRGPFATKTLCFCTVLSVVQHLICQTIPTENIEFHMLLRPNVAQIGTEKSRNEIRDQWINDEPTWNRFLRDPLRDCQPCSY